MQSSAPTSVSPELQDNVTPAPVGESSPTDQTQQLSKKAQKRLARAAYIAEQKKERRAAEKERRKEKKRILAEKRAVGELDEDGEARVKKKRRLCCDLKRPFNARVVVDLGFDDKMTDNEVKSLTSQLAYTYSANRKAAQSFANLLFTSLNGRTLTRMEGMSDAAYKRWVNAEWWTESYESLWQSKDNLCPVVEVKGKEVMDAAPDAVLPGKTAETTAPAIPPQGGQGTFEDAPANGEGVEGYGRHNRQLGADTGGLKLPSSAPKESVIYLTADSQDELTELKEGETYIIGGICDHNRYKNLCLNKSQASGVRSARLPIVTYLASLKTRKVLTVNQTFEILLKWVETRDWEQALEAVIPKRKFNSEGRKRGGKTGKVRSVDADGNADEGDEEGSQVIVDVAELEALDQQESVAGGTINERATTRIVNVSQ